VCTAAADARRVSLLLPAQAKRRREWQAQREAPATVIPQASPAQQAAAGQQQAQQQAAAPPSLFGTTLAATPPAAGAATPPFGTAGGVSPQPFGGFGTALGQGTPPGQSTLSRSKSSASGSGQRRKR
jgi:hypothetical protein